MPIACPNCGKKVLDGWRYCPSCGFPLVEMDKKKN